MDFLPAVQDNNGMKSQRDKSVPKPSHQIREDVIWCDIDVDEYEELPLAPLDSKTEASRRAIRESYVTVSVEWEEEPTPPTHQFTLVQLIIAQACFAVLFGTLQILAPSLVAGALGIGVLVMAILMSLYKSDERHVYMAWWTVFSFYLIACLVAIIRQ
jgi:hypothetical protein